MVFRGTKSPWLTENKLLLSNKPQDFNTTQTAVAVLAITHE